MPATSSAFRPGGAQVNPDPAQDSNYVDLRFPVHALTLLPSTDLAMQYPLVHVHYVEIDGPVPTSMRNTQ